jgi:hypothetical protein
VLKDVGREKAIKMVGIINCGKVHVINSPNAELLMSIAPAARGDLEGHNFEPSLGKLIATVTP